MTTLVKVVAWESPGNGGGFDWYPRHVDITAAIKEEQENCKAFAKQGWRCCYFTFNVENMDNILDEIDDFLASHDFEKLPNFYKFPY